MAKYATMEWDDGTGCSVISLEDVKEPRKGLHEYVVGEVVSKARCRGFPGFFSGTILELSGKF